EWGGLLEDRVRHQFAEAAAHVIEKNQLAIVILAEADEPQTRFEQLTMIADGLALGVIAKRPDAAGVVVAIDVLVSQILELFAVVNIAAGDGAEVGVIVLDDRHENRRWPARPLGAKRMAAFQNAPAVVAAALDL